MATTKERILIVEVGYLHGWIQELLDEYEAGKLGLMAELMIVVSLQKALNNSRTRLMSAGILTNDNDRAGGA